jgi:hypothetical protein
MIAWVIPNYFIAYSEFICYRLLTDPDKLARRTLVLLHL